MRRFINIAFGFWVLLFLCSCEVETSSHGNLYGFWHLESIDSIDGGINDMSDQLIFWSIQAKLIICSDQKDNTSVLFKFYEDNDLLNLGQAHMNDRDKGDPVLTELNRVQPYGLGSLSPIFHIDKLSSNRLILSDEYVRLNFKKF